MYHRDMKRHSQKMKRIATTVPVEDYKAMDRAAEENGRSLASETRIAIAAHLKAIGRRA